MAAMMPESPTPRHVMPQIDAEVDPFQFGAQLHAKGQLEPALVQFEQAMVRHPTDTNAMNACVGVLLDLERPMAAYELMLARRELFASDTDSLCNWAIVCEAVGKHAEAALAYERVLQLDAMHLRALNNSALNALNRHDWPVAIQRLQRCCELAPNQLALHINLVDAYTAAHESASALQLIEQVRQRWPADPDVELRHAVQLAFNGHLQAADAALGNLSDSAKMRLEQYLGSMSTAAARIGRTAIKTLPAAQELYFIHQFAAMNDCDWRQRDNLCRTLRQAIAASYSDELGRDWRDVQFYLMMLPFSEEEHAQTLRATTRIIKAKVGRAAPKRAAREDNLIRLGIATQSLHDPRHRHELLHWMQMMDRSRFAVYLYANTPMPQAALAAPLTQFCESLVEINHMTPSETAQRMQLDGLDVFLDTAYNTPWCRAELPHLGVAPINIRQQAWTRWITPGLYQYNIGDPITHPDDFDRQGWGPTLRLPRTCWLALERDQPAHGLDRRTAGLPESALVLCGFTAGSTLDADSFALWMQALKRLPDAVLWLPSHHAGVRGNLLREAKTRGIASNRLIFSQEIAHSMPDFGASSRAMQLAQLKLADLFLDPLRYSSAHNLSDSLRLGVPSLAVLGNNMASRLGASIVHAAGLPQAVLNSSEEWLEALITWAQSPAQQNHWRQHLLSHQPGSATPSALFDTAARMRDWSRAFETMHQRHIQGLKPMALDLPV